MGRGKSAEPVGIAAYVGKLEYLGHCRTLVWVSGKQQEEQGMQRRRVPRRQRMEYSSQYLRQLIINCNGGSKTVFIGIDHLYIRIFPLIYVNRKCTLMHTAGMDWP